MWPRKRRGTSVEKRLAFPMNSSVMPNLADEIKEISTTAIFSCADILIFLSVLLNVLRRFVLEFHLQSIMDKVTPLAAFSHISAPWQPHIAGELNGQLIKLVKFQGE